MSETILAALVTGGLALAGTFLSNRRNAALIAYRMEQLEKKVDRHNGLVERMTAAEGRLDALEDGVKELKGLVIHS